VPSSPFGAVLAVATALIPGGLLAQQIAPSAADVASPASAIVGPFAIGATVKDRNGETVGRITRLTTARDGRTLVMVRLGVDSFALPAARLHVAGDIVTSHLTKDELKAEGRLALK